MKCDFCGKEKKNLIQCARDTTVKSAGTEIRIGIKVASAEGVY